jgi:NAD(P)-dependent dehydrogenase (short-subunit alcohol dehydrogenase family)
MKIGDSTVLVTGANRGLGKALVEEALRRGAKRVYAGARQPIAHADRRVTLLMLDVTNAAQIGAAVEKVDAIDIPINNAGISLQNDLSDRAALEQLLAVNLFGTYDVTLAFLPVLARPQSAIVNVLSLASLAAVPFDSLYSISKAATFSLSQSLRALLAGRGVSVHARKISSSPFSNPSEIACAADSGEAFGMSKPRAISVSSGPGRAAILCRSPLRRAGATVP